jgi:hypothetical protein
MFADFVDGHNMRMIETGSRLGLAAETLHLAGRSELARQNHLERDRAIEADLSGLVI